MHNVEHKETRLGDFSVSTEVFSGPLELLIDLIEKRKLLVNDISLAAVTDEYIEHVKEIEVRNLGETSHFVALASTLLLIKSKSLLPVFELTEEEEESIEDLEERLRLYKIFRGAAKQLSESFGKHMSTERLFVPSTLPLFLTDSYTTIPALQEAMYGVLEALPEKKERPKVAVKKTITLETMMERLQSRIEHDLSFRFNEFARGEIERANVIVGFLAVLEMVKQGLVMVQQNEAFHDIQIEREPGNTPRYL